jgi:sugar phosphate isomerase/epimerase
MKTRTGMFPLGFRLGRWAWAKDSAKLLEWIKDNEIEVIDLGSDAGESIKSFIDAGVRIGSIDLVDAKGMISSDAGRRAAAIGKNAEFVKKLAVYGPLNYFLVMLPEDPGLPRGENFGYMVESFGELVPVLESSQARIVIEGWPGPGALCCTPEGYRALFEKLPSKAMSINYDPSHLIRQGIDPIRFLGEFGDRVAHIHGKDTELLPENLYEYGHEQPPTFAKRFAYGSMAWRYTIPGHGSMRWGKALAMLKDMGYEGCVSIELEDANFNGAAETEKLGILQGIRFLAGC